MSTVKFPPLTVEEAVDYLQANMPLNYKIELTTMRKEDLLYLPFSLGAYARDILGLWSGNEALIESCRILSGNKDLDADDTSMLTIEILWKRLQDKDDIGLASGRDT